MNKLSLEEMSGEKQRAPKLTLNEIIINGEKGVFKYRDVKGGQDPETKRYNEFEIGEKIEVTFLKIRRKLMQHIEDARPYVTNEHNSKTDYVALFGVEGGTRRGTAAELRDEFEGLRTVQVVYALYKGELVRLFVKGASLGSKAKEKTGEHDFYSYVASFKDEGRDDHFYEVITELTPLEEKKAGRSYYCLRYKEGRKLDTDEMESVEENMKIAFEYCKSVDDYYKKDEIERPAQNSQPSKIPNTDMDYPEEEQINPEDIPF